MSDLELFDASSYRVEAAPDPYAGLGHDARRTARRRALLAESIHPITKRPIRPDLGQCRDCAHLLVKDIGRAKRWFKCDLALDGSTGPDVRLSYPACAAFEAAE